MSSIPSTIENIPLYNFYFILQQTNKELNEIFRQVTAELSKFRKKYSYILTPDEALSKYNQLIQNKSFIPNPDVIGPIAYNTSSLQRPLIIHQGLYFGGSSRRNYQTVAFSFFQNHYSEMILKIDQLNERIQNGKHRITTKTRLNQYLTDYKKLIDFLLTFEKVHSNILNNFINTQIENKIYTLNCNHLSLFTHLVSEASIKVETVTTEDIETISLPLPSNSKYICTLSTEEETFKNNLSLNHFIKHESYFANPLSTVPINTLLWCYDHLDIIKNLFLGWIDYYKLEVTNQLIPYYNQIDELITMSDFITNV